MKRSCYETHGFKSIMGDHRNTSDYSRLYLSMESGYRTQYDFSLSRRDRPVIGYCGYCDFRKRKSFLIWRGWGWITAIGILMTVVGFISFMNPVAGIIAVTTLCGILLVFQGIGFIINALFSGRFMRP